MSWNLKPSKGGEEFEKAPPGNHPAVLVALIDLGTQETRFGQNPPKWMRQVYLVWELIGAEMSGTKGVHHVIGRNYTVSLGEKALLRGIVEKWRNKQLGPDEEFDLLKLVGKPCLLTVTEKTSKTSGNKYTVVDGVASPPKGMNIPKPQRTPFSWMLESGTDYPAPDWVPHAMVGGDRPEPVKDIIDRCQEKTGKGRPHNGNGAPAQQSAGVPAGAAEEEESVPF